MNLLSFVDELVKVGAARCLLKRAADITSAIPDALMNAGKAPPSQTLVPDDASTRLPSRRLPTAMVGSGGQIGSISSAKKPIDRERFNRPFTEHS